MTKVVVEGGIMVTVKVGFAPCPTQGSNMESGT